jgi:hypothetical protein
LYLRVAAATACAPSIPVIISITRFVMVQGNTAQARHIHHHITTGTRERR